MTQAETLKILKMGENIFLTGAAGSGKTHVLKEYIKFLKEHEIGVAVTASTGIAATHLKGVTIHSWSGIGIRDTLSDREIDEMEQQSYLWKRFEKTNVLIIDEISMLSATTLNLIDRVAKNFKRNNKPFGGMQVIFSGDFFQLPPIEKRTAVNSSPKEYQEKIIFMDEEEEEDIIGTPFAFKAKSWKEAKLCVCYLSEQFRQNDDEFSSLLGEIRDGTFSEKSVEILNKRIIQNEDEEITKLFTHNVNVDGFNNKKIAEINEEEKTFRMLTKGKVNLIESLKKGCLVPEHLLLKKGALVMFVKNNPTVGYINGTVGRIVNFIETYPMVECDDGERYLAKPQTWSIEDGGKILAEISQVPLKLAWAVTIHKSQGMTLNKAVIDLSNAFVEGQGYVAISRVKSLKGLFLKGFNKKALEVHKEIISTDKKLKEDSSRLFNETKKINQKDFKERHEAFLKRVRSKK